MKGTGLSVFHLVSFLGFLDGWKRESNSPYFCVWEFNDGFSVSAWTFFSFYLLPNNLLMHSMVTEMAYQDSCFWSYCWGHWVTSWLSVFPDWFSSFQKLQLKVPWSVLQSVDIKSDRGQGCQSIWILNGGGGAERHFFPFFTSGVILLCIWDGWGYVSGVARRNIIS